MMFILISQVISKQSVWMHQIRIAANRYVPLGEDNLLIGVLEEVIETPFDFRDFASFSQGFNSQHTQHLFVKGYDHPCVLE